MSKAQLFRIADLDERTRQANSEEQGALAARYPTTTFERARSPEDGVLHAGDWDSGNAAFTLSREPSGTTVYTPSAGSHVPGMLWSPLVFAAR